MTIGFDWDLGGIGAGESPGKRHLDQHRSLSPLKTPPPPSWMNNHAGLIASGLPT